MTARHAVAMIVIGLCVDVIAVLFKVQHWPGAGVLFVASALPHFLGLAVLGIKVLRYPGFKDFLDR